MNKSNNSAQVFQSALTQVESVSIRIWAQSQRNLPIWLQIAEGYVGKPDASTRLAIDITTSAMGF